MHAPISAVFSLFLFYHFLSFFLSLSSFTLSFMLFSHCEFLLFHLWLPLPFIVNWSMRFLLFVPKISPTTFGFLWAFLQDCPLTRWLPSHYLCSECACCTIPRFGQNSTLFCFSPHLSYLTWMDKGLSSSLYLPLWHLLGGPSPLPTSFGQNAIPARHFSKKKSWWEP